MRNFPLALLLACLCAAASVFAQDPVKVDPKHYTVEVDNERVRVLRVHYGPHEKSVMHEHPAGIAVFLTENRSRFTLGDGKTVERAWKVGDAQWIPAETHLPENLISPWSLCLST
jgi:quercetin dioxygenase-like cupin family protein